MLSDSDPINIQPATEEAVNLGCLCQLRDGEEQDNELWPDFITTGCPVHDPIAALRKEIKG